jgi:hypothetical protein
MASGETKPIETVVVTLTKDELLVDANKEALEPSPMELLAQIGEDMRQNNQIMHEAARKERQLNAEYEKVLRDLPFGTEVTVSGSGVKLHRYSDGEEIGKMGPGVTFRGELTEHSAVHDYQMLLVNNPANTYVLLKRADVRDKFNIADITLPQPDSTSEPAEAIEPPDFKEIINQAGL